MLGRQEEEDSIHTVQWGIWDKGKVWVALLRVLNALFLCFQIIFIFCFLPSPITTGTGVYGTFQHPIHIRLQLLSLLLWLLYVNNSIGNWRIMWEDQVIAMGIRNRYTFAVIPFFHSQFLCESILRILIKYFSYWVHLYETNTIRYAIHWLIIQKKSGQRIASIIILGRNEHNSVISIRNGWSVDWITDELNRKTEMRICHPNQELSIRRTFHSIPDMR